MEGQPSLKSPQQDRLRAALALLALTVSAISILVPGRPYGPAAAWLPLTLSILCLVLVFALPVQPGLTLDKVYLPVLWVFHFGLVAMWLASQSSVWLERMNEFDRNPSPVDLSVLAVAMSLAGLGFTSVTAGIATGYLILQPRHPRSTNDVVNPSAIAVAGLLVVCTAAGGWILIGSTRLGWGFASESYKTWLYATAGSKTWLVYILLMLGMALAGASSQHRVSRVTLLAFTGWAIPAFSMGLRGEVLFPLLAYLVTRSRLRTIRLDWRVLAAAALFLSLGTAAKHLRQVGLVSATDAQLSADPLEGLAETGFSLNALYNGVVWHQFAGEPHTGAIWLLGPFDNALAALGFPTGVAPEDYSLMAVVGERLGGWGGSVIAEGYRAFGVIGVVAYMFALGFFIAYLVRGPRTPLSAIWLGCWTGILLLAIRNDSTQVVLELLIAVAIVAGLRFISPAFAQGQAREDAYMVSTVSSGYRDAPVRGRRTE